MSLPPSVVSIISNLFFATRIEATGRQVQVGVLTVRPENALERCRAIEPLRIFLDLEAPADPGALIRTLKSEPALSGIPIVGFYPHVRDELRESALAAGIDVVLPRSA